MQGAYSLDSVLWEDLGEVDGYTARTRAALDEILAAIQSGLVGQPNPLDNKHLNRLIVLSEMFYNEVKEWAAEIDRRAAERQLIGHRKSGSD